MVTRKGQCIRFHESDVRVTGRVSMGVIGMKLDEDDEVIGMQMDSQGETLLVVSASASSRFKGEAEKESGAIRSWRKPDIW